MSTQLTIRSVSLGYPGRLVLDAVTCAFPVGERSAVIGENGSGKSTLLRLLAGRARPDDGEVLVSAVGGVGYLAQDAELPPDHTVSQAVDAALHEIRALAARLRTLETRLADATALAEYGEVLTAFELRDGYAADARAAAALSGLGLGHLPADRPLGALSGGEAVRLRLACVLIAAPEVLLLDEPTNHLDDNALTWLTEHLRTRTGSTVTVSHDRDFLDAVTRTLVELEDGRLTRYGTGYDGYLAEHAAARQRQEQAHDRWQTEIDRQRITITHTEIAPGRAPKDNNKMAYDRAGARVQKSLASRVRNAEERLRRLLAEPVLPPPEPLRFNGSFGRPGSGLLLAADGVAVKGRLAPVSLSVRSGERLLITGENGAGKSTLLRVLAGELPADRGTVTRRGRIGYLAQEPRFDDPQQTVLSAFGGEPEKLLALGLLPPDKLGERVGALSTGQRQRLSLARLLTRPADVLLLDEPTNHLSLLLAEQLETALKGTTVVLVSHDRRLRRNWPGETLELTCVN